MLAAGLTVAALAYRRRLGGVGIGIALLVAAGALVYGLGLIALPDPERAIERVGTTLGSWTYVVVAAMAFLESAAFVGLVAPGELAVVFGGMVAGHGEIDVVTLIFVVWLSALAGDLTGYALGRRLGHAWAERYGARFGVTRARLQWAERYFAAHGVKTIVIGRFVGIVRSLAPFTAGTSRMPLRRFVLADAVSAGIWAATFSILGYVFWRSLDQVLGLIRRGNLVFAGVVLFALAAFFGYRLARDRSARRRVVKRVRRLLRSSTAT